MPPTFPDWAIAPPATQDEVQDVALDGVPASGSFQLVVNGTPTAAIQWNDNAAAIQGKVNAVYAPADAVVTGSLAAQLIHVDFGVESQTNLVPVMTVPPGTKTIATAGPAPINLTVIVSQAGQLPAIVPVDVTHANNGWQFLEKPPFNMMNDWMNRVGQWVRLLNSGGLAQWQATRTYAQGDLVLVGSDVYQSLTNANLNNNPNNSNFWARFNTGSPSFDVKRWWAYNFDQTPASYAIGCPALALSGSGPQSLVALPPGNVGNGLRIDTGGNNNWGELDTAGLFHVHRFGDRLVINGGPEPIGLLVYEVTFGMLDVNIGANTVAQPPPSDTHHGYLIQVTGNGGVTVMVNDGSANSVTNTPPWAWTPGDQFEVIVGPASISFQLIKHAGVSPAPVVLAAQNPAEGTVLKPVFNVSSITVPHVFLDLLDVMMRFNPMPS